MQSSMAGAIIGDGELILGEMVGHGAMGAVYRAHQTSLDRVVAVKILKTVTDNSDFGHRLVDEAKAAARIRHPRLVEVIDVGEDASFGPYVIYEFLPGDTFEKYLEKTGKLDWQDTFSVAGQGLLEALEAIHCAGIIHRDVKPANLLANDNGDFLLADLGLAVFEGRSAQTKTGAFFGTPGYLAPERISPKACDVTPACDIYAAALVMVRAMTGKLPFKGYTTMEVLQNQLERELTPAVLVEEGLAKELATVFSWALLRDPKKRCSDARELLDKLKELRIGAVTSDVKSPVDKGTKATSASSSSSAGETRVLPTRDKRAVARTVPAKSAKDGQAVDTTAAKAIEKTVTKRRSFVVPAICLLLFSVFLYVGSRLWQSQKKGNAEPPVTTSLHLLRSQILDAHPSCPPKKIAQLGQIFREHREAKGQVPKVAADELVGLYHLMSWSLDKQDYQKAWTYGHELMRRKSPLTVDKPSLVIDKLIEAGLKQRKWKELIAALRPIDEEEGTVDGAAAALIGRVRARLAIIKNDYRNKDLRDALRELLPSLRRVIAIGGKRELKAMDLLFVILALGQKGTDKVEFIKINEGILQRKDLDDNLRASLIMRSAQRLVLCWPAFKKDLDTANAWAAAAIAMTKDTDLRAELRARSCSVILETPLTMHWEDKVLADRENRIAKAYQEVLKARSEAKSISTKTLVDLYYGWVLRYKQKYEEASRYLDGVKIENLPEDQRWWYWRIKHVLAYELKGNEQMAALMKRAYEAAPPEYFSNLDDVHKP